MGHKDKYKSFRKVTGCDLLWHQRRKNKTHGGIYINSLSSTSPVSFFHHSCGQSGWKEDNTMMEIRWRRWGSAGVGGVRGGEWFAATARGSYRVCRMSCGHKQPHTHCRSTTATALAHGHRPEPHPHGGWYRGREGRRQDVKVDNLQVAGVVFALVIVSRSDLARLLFADGDIRNWTANFGQDTTLLSRSTTMKFIFQKCTKSTHARCSGRCKPSMHIDFFLN